MVKRIVQLIIFLGIGVFFIWFSIKDLKPQDVEIIRQSAQGIMNTRSLLFILSSMGCGALAHYFRALRNILLINPLGFRVRKTTAFYSVMICYLANLALPRLGEVLRCSFLQRYDQVPFQKSFGTVVAERAFDFIIFLILFVLILFINKGLFAELALSEQLGGWMKDKMELIWAAKFYVLFIAIALITSFVAYRFLIRKKHTSSHQNHKQSKMVALFKNILVGLWQGLISIKDLKKPYLFIVYTISIWVFYYLGTFLCMFAFDFLQSIGPMPPFVILVIGAISFMIAQGGLGAYPLFVAGILALYGIEYAQGLAAGWIGWCAQTLMILVVGLITFVLASFLKVENRAY